MIFEQLVQLFRPGEPPPEDPQAYREALVDLLIWTMFVDHHLALAEQELLDSITDDLEWTSLTPLAHFVHESTARARAVLEGGESAAAEYLLSIRDRVHRPEHRRRVIDACRAVINSDGKLRPQEVEHLKAVSRSFQKTPD